MSDKLDNDLDKSDNLRKCDSLKNDSEIFYGHIAERIKIRRKCDWYEQDKKSAKLFLSFNKVIKIESENCKWKRNNKECEILNQIKLFYEMIFQNSSRNCQADIDLFLSTTDTPKLSTEQINFSDIEINWKRFIWILIHEKHKKC